MDSSDILDVKVIDGGKIKNISVASGSTDEQILINGKIPGAGCSGKVLRYSDNPIVGVFRNGVCQPVSTVENMSSELKPIRVFDSYGRRIYRHSLCYLLFYAAKRVIPKRSLVIGHSLGDGFWFSFSDGLKASEKEIALISGEMRKISLENKEICYRSMPTDTVRTWFIANSNAGTVKYLDSINRPVIDVYSIDDYIDISFEPIVSRTSVLSLFELRPFRGGMILRYPVSTSVNEIVPFRDNSKIFEVFCESRKQNVMFNVCGVGDMYEKFCSGQIPEFVRLAESVHRRQLSEIATNIWKRNAKAVFICGPSSSGKTTFAKRLCEQLMLFGLAPVMISLDNYYKPKTECPLDSFGNPDLECIGAIRTEMFKADVTNLLNGKDVILPQYDFTSQQTLRTGIPIRLEENTVFVVEGIHALNPEIYSAADGAEIFRIYVSPLTQLNMDEHNRVSTTDNRILRRLIRDYRTRNASASETLNMWANVERGERANIFPFQNNADAVFNSALDYEIGVIALFAVPLLMGVHKTDGDAYPIARRLLEFLSGIHPIDADYVPKDSLLREFIGHSDYE